MWVMGRPASRRSRGIDDRQRLFLRRTARRTWEYFARFVGPGHHGLPPDNVQQDPPIGEATRTSPTNMGMALLGNLAAWDFGYVSVGTLLDRTRQAFRTMEALPRHRGHFLNWYDTQTLAPIPPRYVSTADSGNLAGSLVALKAGLAELADRPILPPRWRQGLEDVVGILLEELDRPKHADTPASRLRRDEAERVRTSMVQSDGVPAIGRNRPARGIQGTVRPRLGGGPHGTDRGTGKRNRLLAGRGTPPERRPAGRPGLAGSLAARHSPHQKQDGHPSPFQDAMPSLRDLANPAQSRPDGAGPRRRRA